MLKLCMKIDAWSGWIKFGLICAMLWCSGIISAVYEVKLASDEESVSFEVRTTNEQIMLKYSCEIVARAKEKYAHSMYTPQDYFADIDSLMSFKEICKGVSISTSTTTDLQSVLRLGVGRGDFTNDDISNAAQEYRWKLERGDKYREEFEWVQLLIIIPWLWAKYLALFIPGMIWYLVWFSQECALVNRCALPSSVWRLTLAVILYPAVLIYIFARWFRTTGYEYLAEAEYRRTKESLFAPLTRQEKERIKWFARSGRSLSWWRKDLRFRGLFVQHGWCVAFSATLLIAVLPRVAECATVLVHSQYVTICTIAVDNDVGPPGTISHASPDAHAMEQVEMLSVSVVWYPIEKMLLIFLILQRIAREIIHVPKFRVFCLAVS